VHCHRNSAGDIQSIYEGVKNKDKGKIAAGALGLAVTVAPEIKPGFSFLKGAFKFGKVEEGVVFRSASGTAKSLTPRAADANGLSGSLTPIENATNVKIDPSKLSTLQCVCDNVKTGHVSIAPGTVDAAGNLNVDQKAMQSWMDSRETNKVHDLTRELLGAIVGREKY